MYTVKFGRSVTAALVSSLLCCSAFAQHYVQNNLVSNVSGVAATMDSNLRNPWGLSRSSSSPWWVSDNHTGLSTLYDGAGATLPLVVTIPPAVKGQTGSPTGTIYNGTLDFLLAPGLQAVFLFCTEDGTISGWNSKVVPDSAVIKWNPGDGSSYKGMTSAVVRGQKYLYAANFAKGRIDVFDTEFAPVALRDGQFGDPDLPFGFSPYNVQLIGENLYVAYAQPQSSGGDANVGPGLGVVDVFSTSGKLLLRLEDGDHMNEPWGMALAPGDFGRFSHDILVGQFGSGQIAAFNPVTGSFEGLMVDIAGLPVYIPGLWGLSFGNNGKAGSGSVLYFAAGINDENDGLIGTLTPLPADLVAGNGQ
jgi:uncharacterized protein (TIGR03118 family)